MSLPGAPSLAGAPQAAGAPQVAGTQRVPVMQQPAPQPPTVAAAWHGSPAADGNGAWYYQPATGTGTENGAQPPGGAAMNGNGTGFAPGQPNGYGNGQQNGYAQVPPGAHLAGAGQFQPNGDGAYASPAANGLASAAPQYPPPAPAFQPVQQVQPPPEQQQPQMVQLAQAPEASQIPQVAQVAQVAQPGQQSQPAQPLPQMQQVLQAQTGYAQAASPPLAAPTPVAPPALAPAAPPLPAPAPLAQAPPAQAPPAQAPPAQAMPAQAMPTQAMPAQAAPAQVMPAVSPVAEPAPTAQQAALPLAVEPGTASPPGTPAATTATQPAAGSHASPFSKLTGAVRGRRAARKPRLAMSAVFADLVDMADIPRAAYAVDEEVTGAMCLFKTDGGYEVFSCAEDARHEVRFFEDEEAAYFYLFGVLAAEALRNGRLTPRGT
jgi:hypothetical protein